MRGMRSSPRQGSIGVDYLLIGARHTVKKIFWEIDTYPVIAGYISSYSWMSILMDINPAISG